MISRQKHQLISLLRSGGFYLLSQVSIFAAPIALIPILTRTLTPEDFGIASLFLTLSGSLGGFVLLSGTGAVTRKYFVRHEDSLNFPEYIFNALLLNVGLAILAAPVTFALWFFEVLELPTLVFALLPLMLAFSCLKSYKHKLWNVQKNSKAFALFDLSYSVCLVALVLFSVFFVSDGWQARVFPSFLLEGLFCIIGLYFLLREDGLKARPNWVCLRDILKYGLPLFPHTLGLMLLSSFDRLILGSLTGTSSVGVYAIAVSYASLLSIVTIAIDNMVRPHLFELFKRNLYTDHFSYIMIFLCYLAVVCAAGLGLYATRGYLFPIFVGPSFQNAQNFVGWLILGQVFVAIYRFWIKAIFFSGVTFWVSVVSLLAGILSALSYFVLIPIWGVEGAAISALLGSITSALLSLSFSLRVFPLSWKSIKSGFYECDTIRHRMKF